MQVALAMCEPALVSGAPSRGGVTARHRWSLLALGSVLATGSVLPGWRCPALFKTLPFHGDSLRSRGNVGQRGCAMTGDYLVWFCCLSMFISIQLYLILCLDTDLKVSLACRHLSKVKVVCEITRVEVVRVCTAPCADRSRSPSLVHLCSLLRGNPCAIECNSSGSEVGQCYRKPPEHLVSRREVQIGVWQQSCIRQG